jgi:tetratricopeptide (TPR) repeat protein
VVHRDIKPDNVLLSEGHAVVTDFGVAKAVSASAGESSLTSAGVSLGTPSYMSPEQAVADPHVDHRADIYAVGAMAYEMLCGRPPFMGHNPQAILAAHVADAPEPVTKHRATVPSVLNQVVMRCLEKKPADRWQQSEELLPQLDALLAPSGGITPVGTQPIAALDHEAAARLSHPVRVAALFGFVSALLLGLVYLLMIQLGLPDWVLVGSIAVVVLALPIVMATGVLERRRALIRSNGTSVATPPGGVQYWLTWRKSVAGGGLAFGGLAIAAAGYMAMRLLGIGPVGTLVASGVLEERERIVLAEFENRATDSTLGEIVTELFRIDLAQSPAVTVIEPSQVARVLARMERDPTTLLTYELATEVAVREGLKAVVAGDVLPVGGGYVVSTRLVAAGSGDVLVAFRQTAAGPDEVVTAVDRLSASLRERIGESLRTIRADPPLARVTTRSMEALRQYALAERADDQGEHQRAIDLLEEAIAEDTGFAMAYRKLGIILINTTDHQNRANEAFTKAFELRDRLTERERYLAAAAYYSDVQNDESASAAAYRTVLDKYPTDGIALNNLALHYNSLGNFEEGEKLLLRSLALGGAVSVTYTNAIETRYYLGKTDSAWATFQRYVEEYPGQPDAEQYRAAFASARGDYATAEAHIRTLLAAQRGNSFAEAVAGATLAQLYAVRGRLAETLRAMMEAFAIQEEGQLGWIKVPRGLFEAQERANFELRWYDDAERALAILEEALQRYPLDSLSPWDRGYLDLANRYARVGRPERAKQWIARWEAEISERRRQSESQQRNLHRALGAIALAEGRFEDAIAEYRRQREAQRDCPLCGLFSLAETYDRAGAVDSAVGLYERFLTTPALDRIFQESDSRWLALRRLGELYEQRGERQKAIDYYNEFAELWEDADAELQPLVDDVRQRIARLIGER